MFATYVCNTCFLVKLVYQYTSIQQCMYASRVKGQCTGRKCMYIHVSVIHSLQCLYNQEQKGIISALESVDGLVLACMGQKVQSQLCGVVYTADFK